MSAESDLSHTPPDAERVAVVPERDVGIVQQVDTVGREVHVLFSTGTTVFDVPLDCPIVLRGERVKLRMLQAGDRVRVIYSRRRGLLVGQLLEVQPENDRRGITS